MSQQSSEAALNKCAFKMELETVKQISMKRTNDSEQYTSPKKKHHVQQTESFSVDIDNEDTYYDCREENASKLDTVNQPVAVVTPSKPAEHMQQDSRVVHSMPISKLTSSSINWSITA